MQEFNNYGKFSPRIAARSCKTRPAISCKKFCKILQETLQDLAKNPARSCKTSSKILHNNLAPAYAKSLARFLHVQKILQITCKTAKLVQVLQHGLQNFLLFCSKICIKILQDLSTWEEWGRFKMATCTYRIRGNFRAGFIFVQFEQPTIKRK